MKDTNKGQGVNLQFTDPPPSTSYPMMPWGLVMEELQYFGTSPIDTLFDPVPMQNASPIWPEFLALASESPATFEMPASSDSPQKSLHFLDKFTSNTGLVSSFDCGTHEQREQVAARLDQQILSRLQQRITSLAASGMDVPSPLIPENNSDTSLISDLTLNWFNDPLSLKTREILLLIKEVVTIKPRNSSVTLDWSTALNDACVQFFSPSNIIRFLGFYWAIWHPNVNFVHRPSFDILAAKPTVLAAMTLIGETVPQL
jgi:hypothetical protein